MATQGFTYSFTDQQGKQPISAQSSPYDGPVDFIVRANDPDVYLGGTNIDGNLPSSGFEMKVGTEYKLNRMTPDLHVMTTSTSPVTVSVFIQPKV